MIGCLIMLIGLITIAFLTFTAALTLIFAMLMVVFTIL